VTLLDGRFASCTHVFFGGEWFGYRSRRRVGPVTCTADDHGDVATCGQEIDWVIYQPRSFTRKTVAGKVTVGLASHWPYASHTSVVHPPIRAQGLSNGRWAPSQQFSWWYGRPTRYVFTATTRQLNRAQGVTIGRIAATRLVIPTAANSLVRQANSVQRLRRTSTCSHSDSCYNRPANVPHKIFNSVWNLIPRLIRIFPSAHTSRSIHNSSQNRSRPLQPFLHNSQLRQTHRQAWPQTTYISSESVISFFTADQHYS